MRRLQEPGPRERSHDYTLHTTHVQGKKDQPWRWRPSMRSDWGPDAFSFFCILFRTYGPLPLIDDAQEERRPHPEKHARHGPVFRPLAFPRRALNVSLPLLLLLLHLRLFARCLSFSSFAGFFPASLCPVTFVTSSYPSQSFIS